MKGPEELARTNASKLLGVFSDSHVPYEVDRRFQGVKVPSLKEMVQAALSRLASYRNGFVLQVEAGRIDHANHLNDPAATLWDVLAAHETLEHLRKDPFHTAPPRTKPGWGGILLEVEQPTRKLKGPGGLEDQSPWH